jgi:pimeloyl-ACP methyl ester carboxylesterase/predicted small lipoprotein YifL
MKHRFLTWFLALALLAGLAGCGAQPSPTPLPTPTEQPAAIPTQSAVQPPDTPAPAATATPTTAPPTATTAAEPTPQPGTAFESAPCPFDLPAGQVDGQTVECGYLLVPEDRADPQSRTLRLAVAIFHHPDGHPQPDPILYLEGGPGASPLELIFLTFARYFEPLFAANRDIVVFDQRGVGLSEPALDCPDLDELSLDLLDNEIDGQELTDQEMYDLQLETLLDCGADLRAIADLTAYNSAASAADVNDLRLALGYDQVNLWGASYGTRLALEILRTYPEGVRSVVLDATYPPDVDLYVEAPANADRSIDLLFESCAADEACNTAYPDLRTVFFDTVDRLEATPATFQVTDPLTRETYDAIMDGDSLVGALFQFLYATDVLPSLPKIIYDASQDNLDLIAYIFSSLLIQREAVSQGMQFTVQCNEELSFSSLDQFEAALAGYPELAGFFENSKIGTLSYETCPQWGAGQAAPSANEPVTSDVPALILAGEYDPVTPPAWAQHVATTLANSYVFEFPGVGHGASVVAGCPQEMMLAFLEAPSAAPDDSCIAAMDGLQFVVPGAGAETVELVPFSNEQFGIQGAVPAGWEEVSPGAFARQSSGLDVALILVQSAPGTAEQPVTAADLLQLLSQRLGLAEPPEPVGQREANGLTWTLYAFTVQGIPVDIALADGDGLALLVLLQSAAEEHDALYDAVFLPVVDALVPLE